MARYRKETFERYGRNIQPAAQRAGNLLKWKGKSKKNIYVPKSIYWSIRMWEHPLIGLARHHGIATRMLDWTSNPLSAAFFAAKHVVDTSHEQLDSQKKLSVLAYHQDVFTDRVNLITVPTNTNEFIRTQEGVLTHDPHGDLFYLRYGRYPSIEDRLTNSPMQMTFFSKYMHPKKLTLPHSEIPELLRLLTVEGLTLAHLMPTLDNVAETIKLQLRFQNVYELNDVRPE